MAASDSLQSCCNAGVSSPSLSPSLSVCPLLTADMSLLTLARCPALAASLSALEEDERERESENRRGRRIMAHEREREREREGSPGGSIESDQVDCSVSVLNANTTSNT